MLKCHPGRPLPKVEVCYRWRPAVGRMLVHASIPGLGPRHLPPPQSCRRGVRSPLKQAEHCRHSDEGDDVAPRGTRSHGSNSSGLSNHIGVGDCSCEGAASAAATMVARAAAGLAAGELRSHCSNSLVVWGANPHTNDKRKKRATHIAGLQ